MNDEKTGQFAQELAELIHKHVDLGVEPAAMVMCLVVPTMPHLAFVTPEKMGDAARTIAEYIDNERTEITQDFHRLSEFVEMTIQLSRKIRSDRIGSSKCKTCNDRLSGWYSDHCFRCGSHLAEGSICTLWEWDAALCVTCCKKNEGDATYNKEPGNVADTHNCGFQPVPLVN